jgi:hypothetical protein
MIEPADGLAGAGQFELVGTHPQASQQPTVRGRTLSFLKHWNGAIYAGYGDLQARISRLRPRAERKPAGHLDDAAQADRAVPSESAPTNFGAPSS